MVAASYARVACTLTLPLEVGGEFQWHICRPDLLVRYFVQECPNFAEVMQETVQRVGIGVPLNLVFYCDEITPGNILRPENKRRFDAFYFSFRELGPTLLCRAEMWMPLAVLRSGVLRTIKGGISNCVRLLLRTFFVDGPFATTGVVLPTPDPVLLFCKFGNLLADEAAIKAVLQTKGAGGIKFCVKCKNVVMQGADLVQGQSYLVETGCSDFRRFDLATDEDVWAAYDNLARLHGTCTKSYFEKVEMASGMNFDPASLLGDMQLRKHFLPASTTTFDWLHVYIASGIVNVEIASFFKRARLELGLTFEHLVKFAVASWSWPRSFSRQGRVVADVFCPARERACKETLKAGASEILGSYPFIRLFVLTIIAPTHKMDKEVKSLLSLFRCLDILVAAKHMAPKSAELLSAIEQHSRDYQATDGSDVKPKHHMAMHVPGQLDRDGGVLLDTFTLERKHQQAKHHANMHANTTGFEKCVISRVLIHQARDLRGLTFGNCLIGKTSSYAPLAICLGADECLVADSLQGQGGRFAVGDVVFANEHAIMVKACAQADDVLCFVGCRLRFQERRFEACAKWRLLPEIVLFRLVDGCSLRLASCWNFEGPDLLLVVT